MFSREQIINALRDVKHPEKKSDIVTLGYVGEVISSASGIKIVLTPEKSNDPLIS